MAYLQAIGQLKGSIKQTDLESRAGVLGGKYSNGRITLKIGKEGLNRLYDQNYHDSLKAMDDLFAALCATKDAEEGVTAFLEKREPVWKDR